MDDNEKYIEEFVKDIPLEDVNPEHRDALKAQLLNAFPRHRLQPTDRPVPTWRIIMRTPITKLAAAAVIVAVLWGGIYLTGRSNVVFADIVAPFLTARTASFTMRMEVEDAPTQTLDCLYAEPIRMRQTSREQGVVVISDLQLGRIVTLNPALKQAFVIEMTNKPDDDQGQFNMFHNIRNHLVEAQEGDGSAEYLGEKEISGAMAIGYRVAKLGLDITVWADPQTKMPLELTYTTGPTTFHLSDIVFDVVVDESLLSLEIPAEYTVRTMQVDASEPTEKDLIEMFRIWAKHMDGELPSALEMSIFTGFVKAQQQKMMNQGEQPSEEDVLQLQQTIANMNRGGMFVQQLPADSDWHYAGKGVIFGDAETPIFWYRPEGAETYRVIYGDMTIDEVPASEIPATPQEGLAPREASEGP